MGEAAPQLPDSEPTHQHKAPLGALFDFEPESDESEPPEPIDPVECEGPDPESGVWPDIKFELRARTIFGRKTFATNNEARLRSAVGSITEVPKLWADLTGQTALEARDSTLRALSQRYRPNGGQPPKRVYVAGNPDSHETFRRIWQEKLVATNHPAFQVWHQIYQINTDRRAANAGYREDDMRRQPILRDSDLAQLMEDLTLIFASEEAIEAFEQPAET